VCLSLKLSSLEAAIDVHLSLLRIRQLAQTDMAADKSLDECVRAALKQVQEDRQANGLPRLQLAFYVVMSCNRKNIGSPCTRSLDTALMFLREKNRLTSLPDRAIQWRAAIDTWMKERVLAERAAEVAERHRLADRGKLFLRELKKAFQTVDRQAKAAFKTKRWPEGIEPISILEKPYVCAVLSCEDGAQVCGPPRCGLPEAQQDLMELRALQQRKGDEALRAEAARRDEEIMTGIFVASLR